MSQPSIDAWSSVFGSCPPTASLTFSSHNMGRPRLLFISANSLPLAKSFCILVLLSLPHHTTHYLSISKQSVMACVSEQWLHSVNSSLYRDVHISEAVAPLGRLVLKSDGYYHFRKPITQTRFERMQEYASYVQILTVDERYDFIVRELIDWSNRGTRPSRYPFPNILSLRCAEGKNRRCWDMSSLMPPSMSHFSITAPEIPLSHFFTIYQSLIEDRTELSSIAIYLRHDTQAAFWCTPLLERLLEKFKDTLTCVHIPEGFMIPSVISCLAKVKDLRDLAIGTLDASETNSIKDYVRASPRGWGKFSSLRRFSYYGISDCLYKDFILISHDLSHVSSFHWKFNPKNWLHIRPLLVSICHWFPNLTSLRLGDSEMYHDEVKFDDIPVLKWSTVRQVLLCRQLTELALHAVRVSVTREQLLGLFNVRPSWKRLELYTKEPFGFEELGLFAKYCPVLTHLGIYFDATSDEDSVDRFSHPATFRYLTSIDFAYSRVPGSSIHTIGRYLYEVCAKPPRVMGWDKETWDNVGQCIADSYVDEETKSGRPMSHEARAYVEKLECSRRLMEVDSESEEDSSEEEEEIKEEIKEEKKEISEGKEEGKGKEGDNEK